MAETLWKDCLGWLVRCQVLPADHRLTWPNAQLIDLARTLQDGALLCQLLHVLKPGCLDLKQITLRPQLSEFVCLKNIRLFLDTCQTQFGMKSNQLFEPAMLCELTDFLKVLECLSQLSKTQAVQARGFPYFPKEMPKNEVEYYNVGQFENLDGIDRNEEDDDEELLATDIGTSRTEAHIYEDLCYVKIPARKDVSEPKTKREHCIRELLDTEKNYDEALKMIVSKFLKPLKKTLNSEEILTIFINIEEISFLHSNFLIDLQKTCFLNSNFCKNLKNLKNIFEKWRINFTIYGRFCSELPKAQKTLDELFLQNQLFSQTLKKCQNETNEGKFRLRDLLSLPMQRILKYHLLLKELKKQSVDFQEEGKKQPKEFSQNEKNKSNEFSQNEKNEKNEFLENEKNKLNNFSQNEKNEKNEFLENEKNELNEFENEDLFSINRSLEIMMDIALYINEVKRDSENIDLIKNIEENITDLQMPENMHLTSYGHLHIDGVVRFRPHESTSPKTRHIFVFDRVMLIVKPTKAVFTYKDALIMDEFRVDETVPTKPIKDKWSHQWHVYNDKDHRLAYTMAVKTEAERKRWIDAIKLALENVSPPDLKKCATHLPLFATFDDPTLCIVCDRLLRGTFYQGYKCTKCTQAVHKECLGMFKDCGKPTVRPRSSISASHRPASATFSTASTVTASKSSRTLSMSQFPSNRSFTDSKLNNQDNQDNQDNQENIQLPTPNRNSVTSPRNSVTSPISPNPASPFNPFSPAPNGGHFTYRTEEEELMSVYPWFGGHMDRGTAEELLKRFSNGTFLVRISSNADSHKAISIKYDGKPWHIKILYSSDQTCYLAPIKFFKSVPELVGWYETHSLADSFQSMNCTLRIPYKRALLPQDSAATSGVILPRAIVRYNFSATSSNMLTIRVGDEVEILGRSGEQRGWWKGRCNGKVGYFPLSYVEELPSPGQSAT